MGKLILIAGGTASGKTMVADQISQQYKELNKDYSLLRIDNYYKNLDQLNVKNHLEVNWDDPNTFNWDKLKVDINNLLNNKKIISYKYNYGTGFHFKKPNEILPSENIILEGIYALYDKELRDKASIKIFIDVDSDIRMMRRIKRDSEGRYSKTFNSKTFMNQWEKKIKPMHNQFVKPTMEYADIILKNNKQLNNKEKISLITLLQTIVVK